ncbi:hybrid sensor histidine kinase/response regulator [Methylobacterium planeticum]|uniref:Sensory/regulatory protein RpfC n=1 Tax=Methylobacterium planeticum TaxID=2615211 RepID=A0A6N6MS95_9HYPH|nr:hybrid sensor histidine kinase/response regulator [Methylobacterium planeticum]KAB1074407.1 response regulator [Methylobacterium planeticum]
MAGINRAGTTPHRSLARRLGRAVVAAVLIALSVGTGLSVWNELDRYAADKRAALHALATVFASASAKAAAARDPLPVEAALRAIAGQPNLVYAALVLPDGSLLAEQGLGLRLSDDVDLDRREGVSALDLALTRTVRLSVPVISGAREVGRVTVIAETADLSASLLRVLGNAAVAASLALLVGLLVSWRLQKTLTRPLIALTETMNAVRANHDYATLAPVTTNDEVGALATTFNGLLGAVRTRDQALAAHRATLEQEVSDRTADLSEAKQVAEAANAAKSTFLATMSHEIRTPMNGLLVMAELLAAADLPQRQRRYAEVIARSGQSLLAIINDILDFAKVEAGKLELERIPVTTAEVTDTVVTLFGERARAKGLDLAAEIGSGVPRAFLGDPVRLGQILGNFVNNALKFTEAGHVLIRVGAREAGRVIELSVADTGIGIPAETLPTIFSAFSQADQSTTRRFGGTGLGLSIAQSLVAAMGGEIGVASEPGRGSTFWIRLPVEVLAMPEAIRRDPAVSAAVRIEGLGSATAAVAEAGLRAAGFAPGPEAEHWILPADALMRRGARPGGARRVLAVAPMGDPSGQEVLRAGLADEVLRWPLVQAEWRPALAALAGGTPFAAPAQPAGAGADLPRFPGARVLVADDNVVNREVAAEALNRCGVTEIVLVENGREAVEAARGGGFDLVLMDGSMPVLDGFAATRAIRAEEVRAGTARVPVVALTAHVIGTAADAWQAAGMDGVLVKPFTLADLARILAATLPHRAGSVAQAAQPGHPAPQPGAGPVLPAGAVPRLLDPGTLASLTEIAEQAGMPFIERLLRLFGEHGPAALDGLEAALATGDVPAVASAAHGLKSMSVNVGAGALAQELARIEQQARVDGLCPEAGTVSRLRPLLADSHAALRRHFETRRAA